MARVQAHSGRQPAGLTITTRDASNLKMAKGSQPPAIFFTRPAVLTFTAAHAAAAIRNATAPKRTSTRSETGLPGLMSKRSERNSNGLSILERDFRYEYKHGVLLRSGALFYISTAQLINKDTVCTHAISSVLAFLSCHLAVGPVSNLPSSKQETEHESEPELEHSFDPLSPLFISDIYHLAP